VLQDLAIMEDFVLTKERTSSANAHQDITENNVKNEVSEIQNFYCRNYSLLN
jgi:hypothetical protein